MSPYRPMGRRAYAQGTCGKAASILEPPSLEKLAKFFSRWVAFVAMIVLWIVAVDMPTKCPVVVRMSPECRESMGAGCRSGWRGGFGPMSIDWSKYELWGDGATVLNRVRCKSPWLSPRIGPRDFVSVDTMQRYATNS